MSTSVYHQRLISLKEKLKQNKVDGILVASSLNRFYLTGFKSDSGLLLVTSKQVTFFINQLDYTRAKAEIDPGFNLVEIGQDFKKQFAVQIKKYQIRSLGIEYDYYTLNRFNVLKEACKGQQIKFINISELLSSLRIVKDSAEIKKIKRAAQITDLAFVYIQRYLKKNLQKGLNEKNVAWELEKFMRASGAEKLAFDSIVGSGSNSAKPHHLVTDRCFKKGDVLLLDFGCVVDGYHSDLSRTLFWGQPSTKQVEIYNLVLQAQEVGLKQIKPGVACSAIDQAAREVIAKAGYGKNFTHSVGHGVGLEIHEAPFLASKFNEVKLQAGMAVTVEPGIYLEKSFGVRIEDLVLVNKDGYLNLSKSEKVLNKMIIV